MPPLYAENSLSDASQSFGASASVSAHATDSKDGARDDSGSRFSRLLLQNKSEFYEVMLAQVQAVIRQQEECYDDEEEEEAFSDVHQNGSSFSPPSFTPNPGFSGTALAPGMSGEAIQKRNGADDLPSSRGFCCSPHIHGMSDAVGYNGNGCSPCSLPVARKESSRTSEQEVEGYCGSNIQHDLRVTSQEDAFSGFHESKVDEKGNIPPTSPGNAEVLTSNRIDSHQVTEDLPQLLAGGNRMLNMANLLPRNKALGLPLDEGVEIDYSLKVQSLLKASHKENTRSSDLLFQHCLSDLSTLSLPPSGLNTMLLTANLWGLEHSMDENVHQADVIGMKYLQGVPSSATGVADNNPASGRNALSPTTGKYRIIVMLQVSGHTNCPHIFLMILYTVTLWCFCSLLSFQMGFGVGSIMFFVYLPK